jgi:hypothetical protein
MKIHEAIKTLQRMDPNDEVFLQFKEDVTEYRNNEHLKDKEWRNRYGDHPSGVPYESQNDKFGR